jgi:hypothetical protein
MWFAKGAAQKVIDEKLRTFAEDVERFTSVRLTRRAAESPRQLLRIFLVYVVLIFGVFLKMVSSLREI